MSQRICNTKSESYWNKPGWHPTPMTWAWLESELRFYGTPASSRLPRRLQKLNARLRKLARFSRRQHRRSRRSGRGYR